MGNHDSYSNCLRVEAPNRVHKSRGPRVVAFSMALVLLNSLSWGLENARDEGGHGPSPRHRADAGTRLRGFQYQPAFLLSCEPPLLPWLLSFDYFDPFRCLGHRPVLCLSHRVRLVKGLHQIRSTTCMTFDYKVIP